MFVVLPVLNYTDRELVCERVNERLKSETTDTEKQIQNGLNERL